MKTTEDTFSLISTAAILEIDRDELSYLVASVDKPLGPGRLYIPDGHPSRIRFTWKHIQTIKKRLRNYKPEPLDFGAVEEVFERLLKNRGLSAEILGSSTPAGGPHSKELLGETRDNN
ncbi:MAG: hypothetical protein WBC05_16125 [Sedimentisphaerales bacterium]